MMALFCYAKNHFEYVDTEVKHTLKGVAHRRA